MRLLEQPVRWLQVNGRKNHTKMRGNEYLSDRISGHSASVV